ncbi:hypothetical protein CW304_09245 [Bacillus sp. UFRGS-B20]|nr:hypothetical protein CW304_09245 [Bacillus sp. UFRGS-B20]
MKSILVSRLRSAPPKYKMAIIFNKRFPQIIPVFLWFEFNAFTKIFIFLFSRLVRLEIISYPLPFHNLMEISIEIKRRESIYIKFFF